MKQSTNHIMMMEPARFHANSQTKATNSYQHDDQEDIAAIQKKAVQEFRAFRDLLIEHGVVVTTAYGQEGSPDDIFCNNWVATLPDGHMTLFPMLADNRRIERRPELIELLGKMYKHVHDMSAYEDEGKFLESTGAFWLDKVNKVAYQGASSRSDTELAEKWCDHYGYRHFPFETEHMGIPVYHTDVVMWIGTSIAGISSECLKNRDIIDDLKQHREVIEFTNAQMKCFCGNSLEVIGHHGEKMLVMSKAGYDSLRDEQKVLLGSHYRTIIKPSIPTIEYYGGGSARCMLLELF